MTTSTQIYYKEYIKRQPAQKFDPPLRQSTNIAFFRLNSNITNKIIHPQNKYLASQSYTTSTFFQGNDPSPNTKFTNFSSMRDDGIQKKERKLKTGCGCIIEGCEDEKDVCDAESGMCICKCNIKGQLCDQCVEGFFEFPNCHGKYLWFTFL